MKLRIIWILAVILSIAACGTPNTPTQPATPEIINTVEPTKQVTNKKPRQDIGKAVIIYQRNGGIAGLNEKWTVYPDGKIEEPGGTQKQVGAEQVQKLLDTIQTAGFFDLADSYVPLDTCCDRFFYSITVKIGEQTKKVSTLDASPTQPEQLTTVISAVKELLFADK